MEKDCSAFPSLGIIIPVGKSDIFIEKFLSAYLQSISFYKGIIYTVVVCNNSSESCVEKIKRYESEDFKVYNIGDCEHGISKARNFGLKKMPKKIDFISFLDDDDCYIGSSLKKIEISLNTEADIICFGWNERSLSGSEKVYKALPRNSIISRDNLYEQDLTQYLKLPRNMPYLGYCWGKFFKRDLILNNFIFFDETISTFEDVLFLMKAISFSKQILFVDKPLLCQNFIIKPRDNKASFAGHSIERGLGFVEVAKFLEKNVYFNVVLSDFDKSSLLTRYCGYLFYFNF